VGGGEEMRRDASLVKEFVGKREGFGSWEKDNGVGDGLGRVVHEVRDEGDGMGCLSDEVFFVADGVEKKGGLWLGGPSL
jgi:hypothetical protein